MLWTCQSWEVLGFLAPHHPMQWDHSGIWWDCVGVLVAWKTPFPPKIPLVKQETFISKTYLPDAHLTPLGCPFPSRETLLRKWDACKCHELNVSRTWQMHQRCSRMLTWGQSHWGDWPSWTPRCPQMIWRKVQEVTRWNPLMGQFCTMTWVFEVLPGRRQPHIHPTATAWPKTLPDTKLPNQHACLISGSWWTTFPCSSCQSLTTKIWLHCSAWWCWFASIKLRQAFSPVCVGAPVDVGKTDGWFL